MARAQSKNMQGKLNRIIQTTEAATQEPSLWLLEVSCMQRQLKLPEKTQTRDERIGFQAWAMENVIWIREGSNSVPRHGWGVDGTKRGGNNGHAGEIFPSGGRKTEHMQLAITEGEKSTTCRLKNGSRKSTMTINTRYQNSSVWCAFE
jgi:hypothetical protein